jgi:PAS domain S-box-containing protein
VGEADSPDLREQGFTRFAIERMSDAAFWMGSDARFVYVNEAACRALGYTREELLSMSVADIDPEFPEEHWPEHWEKLREHGTLTFESRHRTKDGRTIPVEISANHVKFGGSEYNCAFARDISDRRVAEAALRNGEERFRTVIDATTDAMIAIDDGGRVTLFNAAAERMFGRSSEEMLGEPLDVLMPEEYREKHAEFVACYFETGKPGAAIGQVLELPALREDGTVFPMEISLSAGRSGDRRFVIGVARDISDRKEAEAERARMDERIRQTQKLESLGNLAGGIAHDFNNLLTGVLGNASLARARLEEHSPADQSIRRIEEAARRAADLSAQMLAYSGHGRFVVTPLDLSSLVRDMSGLLESTVSEKAALRFELSDALPLIEADSSQIRQVLVNLATNAFESLGGRAGLVTIRSGAAACDRAVLDGSFLDDELPEGMYAYLEVEDTGCGMSRETLAKVFDPFFTTKFTGRGLGLAAVLGIARGHRGTILIESREKRGSRVRVLLPASEAAAAEVPAEAPSTPVEDRTGTVLLVDDEPAIREFAAEVLEAGGFRVHLAEDGDRGIALFREHADVIDCVVLDLTMPGRDGEETFAGLRQIRPDVTVILTSGYSEQVAMERFEGLGLAGFLQKPFLPSQLTDGIGAALGS